MMAIKKKTKKAAPKPKITTPPKPKITTPDNTAFGLTTPAPTDQFDSMEQERFRRALAGTSGATTTPITTSTSDPITPKSKLVSSYTDEETGDQIDVYEDGSEMVRKKGTKNRDEAALAVEEKRRKGQSAYDILLDEFTRYGLQALVEPLKGLITSGASSAEFSLALQNTDAYKKRFAANQKRIQAGLGALSPAEYVAMEDQYQNVMRNYGLPASYYTKDPMGTQQGFEKFLAADVSATELEDRIMTAQTRVINANPEVSRALKQFYPDITNGDILAYTLDPQQGLSNIKRKVTAAEIGGAAIQSGLSTNLERAEELGRYGVDKEAATEGFTTIGAGLQRGSQLASIYGEDPYTQQVAESEIFNIPGAQEARKQRQKITGLERATFGGQTGITQGTLARDRAGAY
jgi:hypothetical protein